MFMKRVDYNLIFTVDLYNMNLGEYVHGYSMVGSYINESNSALKEFEFNINEILKLDSNLKFDILRFIFRNGDLFCSFDISKEQYVACKFNIVENIFEILHETFYKKPDDRAVN